MISLITDKIELPVLTLVSALWIFLKCHLRFYYNTLALQFTTAHCLNVPGTEPFSLEGRKLVPFCRILNLNTFQVKSQGLIITGGF